MPLIPQAESEFLEAVLSQPLKRDPSQEQHISTQIASIQDLSSMLQAILSNQKNPVFSKVKVSEGELSFDIKDKQLVLKDEVVLAKVKITTPITGMIAFGSQVKMKECLFEGELKDNNFQFALFSKSVFTKDVKTTDFQNCNFGRTEFNRIESCNFTNAYCVENVFNGDITGVTCFAGADLTKAVFKGKIDKTVIFIGSNFDMSTIDMNAGGIFTVKQLEDVVGSYSDDELRKLQVILANAYTAVATQIEDCKQTKMKCAVTIEHADRVNRAREIVSTELASRNGSSLQMH